MNEDKSIASVLPGSIFSGLESHADPRRSLLAVDARLMASMPLNSSGFSPGPYRQLVEQTGTPAAGLVWESMHLSQA